MNSATPVNPIAKIHGEPIQEIPQDLYIPPEALEIFLEVFEGPLDLLLYLIRKHDFDILDIPMAELTRQYIIYIEAMRTDQFELAAEYLLMTALLIDIKARMLLPRPETILEEESDPRAELVRRLLEYEQIKQAAEYISTLPVAGKDFIPVQISVTPSVSAQQFPDISLQALLYTWQTLQERIRINRQHVIRNETVSVRACMSEMMKNLQSKNKVVFTELLSDMTDINKLIAGFLALLELVREALIEIDQPKQLGSIFVYSTTSDH